MVCVYVGMGIALALNLFDWDNTALWRGLRWVMAVVFIAYGIYRGHRQLNGTDYYRGRYYDESEEEYEYYDEKAVATESSKEMNGDAGNSRSRVHVEVEKNDSNERLD